MLIFVKMEESLSNGRRRCVVFDTVLEKKIRIRYHQFVWISKNGDVPEGYHIHHIDGDKLNDDISNLILMKESDHHKLHSVNITNENRRNMSERMKGNKINLGRKASEETKKKMSEIRTGRSHASGYCLSEETKKKMSESKKGNKINLGRKMSEDTKEKIKRIVTCPHCGKSGAYCAMMRYHFDKCKNI